MKEETALSQATQIYENLLASVSEYLAKPDQQTFDAALRNLSVPLLSAKKAAEVLEGMNTGDKTQWAFFLARVVHSFSPEGSFDRFKALSPFKDQVIAIAEFNRTSFLIKTNPEFVKFMKHSKINPDSNDYVLVFDPDQKIANIEVIGH
jgi:hypothetical protein